MVRRGRRVVERAGLGSKRVARMAVWVSWGRVGRSGAGGRGVGGVGVVVAIVGSWVDELLGWLAFGFRDGR